MSKYEPLRRYLQVQRRVDTEMSFSEIEEILNFTLPASAHEHSAWWSNERGTHVQAKAWMDAGWQVWQVRRSEKKVYLRPIEPIANAPAGVSDSGAPFIRNDAIVVRRSDLGGGAIRMLEDYCEEKGGDLTGAIVGLLNDMALERRRRLVDWFREHSPRVSGDSTDLIREDRDAR